MRTEFWVGGGIAAYILIAYIIWLTFCWVEGTDEPKGDYFLSPEFVSQGWPFAIALIVIIGLLFVVFYPMVWIHEKIVTEVARRGRERKEAGIANSGPGRVVEEFGTRR